MITKENNKLWSFIKFSQAIFQEKYGGQSGEFDLILGLRAMLQQCCDAVLH